MNAPNVGTYHPEQGKTALITGGTGLLGSALVHFLAQQKYTVIFQYHRNAPLADRLAQECAAHGTRVKGLPVDFNGPLEGIAQWCQKVENEYGVPDIIIHSASAPFNASGFSIENARDFALLNQSQSQALMALAGAFCPGMSKRQSGMIVGILTEAIVPGRRMAGWSAYAASKMAMASYLADMSQELNRVGIRVVGVLPGAVNPAGASKGIRGHLKDFDAGRKLITAIDAGDVVQAIAKIIADPQQYPTGSFVAVGSSGMEKLNRFGFFSQDKAAGTQRRGGSGDAVQARLEQIFRQVFRLPADADVSDARFGSWAEWDSLKHIDLIMELEHALNVRFDEKDMRQLTGFQEILAVLHRMEVEHGV